LEFHLPFPLAEFTPKIGNIQTNGSIQVSHDFPVRNQIRRGKGRWIDHLGILAERRDCRHSVTEVFLELAAKVFLREVSAD
jgi:hypothetical protein